MRPVYFLLTLLLLGCDNLQDAGSSSEKKMTMNGRYIPPEWIRNSCIYEVNIRQYTPEGTFNAFAAHLPRLKQLGVETLWFMPVTPIAQKNRKGSLGSYYACSDYTSINPEFGTADDFKSLVKLAHEMGFKVIIDWVANHTGWDHRWTVEHPEYYLKDSATGDFLRASGMDDIIELDFSNRDMRKAMIEAMQYWVKEFDIDGFRCDLASWVELDFWIEARPELEKLKHLFWLGEYDELENPDYGRVFDASYSWAWMHLTEDFYKKNLPQDTLIQLLYRYNAIGDTTLRAWFTSNHDENSWNGTEFEKYGAMANALAVFSFTWNGIPLLYSGQEIGNTSRIRFFDKDTIVAGPDAAFLSRFYNSLLQLKKNNPALRAGDPEVTTRIIPTSAGSKVLAYLRKYHESEVLVVLNLSGESPLRFELQGDDVKGIFKNIFSEAANDFSAGSNFEMQGWEYAVYEK